MKWKLLELVFEKDKAYHRNYYFISFSSQEMKYASIFLIYLYTTSKCSNDISETEAKSDRLYIDYLFTKKCTTCFQLSPRSLNVNYIWLW